ncbi:MAG TPA: hypothetical protein VLK82_11215 [Candidatus Tectomicrobia bacterium]|nr:hypothetical protein [Candidatus Tectomicrobia bacterium]
MTFEEILDQAIALLQRRGRVTYQMLKVQFQLGDDQLEAPKEELIYGHQLAVDEDGKVLVWVERAPAAAPPVRDRTPAPGSYIPSHLGPIPTSILVANCLAPLGTPNFMRLTYGTVLRFPSRFYRVYDMNYRGAHILYMSVE